METKEEILLKYKLDTDHYADQEYSENGIYSAMDEYAKVYHKNMMNQKPVKMKSKKVIKRTNLPTNSPLLTTVIVITLLDYWKAPAWVWSLFTSIYVFVWANYFTASSNEEPKDIFKDDDRI